MSRPERQRWAVILIAGLLAACGSGHTPTASPREVAGSPSPPPPAATTAATATTTPTSNSASGSPTTGASPAGIQGFEGWSVFNPASVDASADQGTLVLKLTRRALWFQAQQGVLIWKPVTGDFRITSTVSVARTSDPSAPLDAGGGVRLGGLMARADAVRQNYVFVVVGSDADGLSVETKSTRDNASRFEGPAWPAAAADLRLCRSGATFTMLKRPAGSTGPWTVAATVDRPDLPAQLQVGPNLYTDSPPDVTARYAGVALESPSAATACDA